MSDEKSDDRPRRKATVEELERLLAMEDMEVEILPDGSIFSREKISPPKPTTFRENLGGEYAGFVGW
jgi:hypothetical protein